MYKTPFHITAEKLAWSRKLRNNPTEQEKILWEKIKLGQLKGKRFQRQKIILGWIVDFYCAGCKLVIEVDGPTHHIERDKIRDAAMNKIGITVLRFTNFEVDNNIDDVVKRITANLLSNCVHG